MKKCTYCAEEIQDDAIKCRFCGEMLDETGPTKPSVENPYAGKVAMAIGMVILVISLIVVVVSCEATGGDPESDSLGMKIGAGIGLLGMLIYLCGRSSHWWHWE